jgi:hypothetical protein
MKTLLSVSLLIVAVFAVGCDSFSSPDQPGDVEASGLLLDVTGAPLAQADDLVVRATASAATIKRGQTLTVFAIVTNSAAHAVRIDSPDQRYLVVQVWRSTVRGWTVVHEYPEIEFPVVSPWGLVAGGQYTQTIEVPAEPAWPTHETLRLVVDVNGVPAASEPIAITAVP